jgi:hypothetical protein
MGCGERAWVRVTSSPSLRSRAPPQQSQAFGGSITTRSRGRCSGKVFRSGRLRLNPVTAVVLATASSAAKFVFGGARFQLFELQCQLIDESVRALRTRAVDLPFELGDPQLLMGDQGHVCGRLGPRHRKLRGTNVAFGERFPHPGALDHERCLQRVDVVRQGGKIGVHDGN